MAPMSVVPVEKLKSNPNIITAITQHGGHSGWLEGMNPFNRAIVASWQVYLPPLTLLRLGPAWVDRVACEWIDTILSHQISSPKMQKKGNVSSEEQSDLSRIFGENSSRSKSD